MATGLFVPAIAPPLAIPPEDLRTLGQWSRSHSIRAALVERAKILRLAAEGTSNTEIARQVGCSRPTVILWRQRYTQQGLAGLDDQPRQGRPQTVRRDRRAETFKSSTEIGQVGDGSSRAVLEVMPVTPGRLPCGRRRTRRQAQVIVGELAGRIDPVAEQDNLAQATHHTARLRSRPLRFVAESPAQDGAKIRRGMTRSILLICLYQANILDKVNREEQDMGPIWLDVP